MPTVAERGQEVRRRLLAAAVELIPEVGWNAVSTRTLAARAGVGQGLVHYHFASLQALMREAALGAMRGVLTDASTTLDHADGPEQGLTAMLAFLDSYRGDDPTSLLFIEAYLAATRDEALRTELIGLVRRFRQELANSLHLHDPQTSDATVSVLVAAVDGVLLHRALDPDLTSAAVTPVLRRLLPRENDHGM